MKRITAFASLLVVALWCATCSDNPINPPADETCDHVDADGIILERVDSLIATQWLGTVSGSISVAEGETGDSIEVLFLNQDSARVVISESCDQELRWTIEDTAIAAIALVPGRKWNVNVTGKAVGSTTARLRIWHGDHADFTSQPITITVISSGPPHIPIGATAAAVERHSNMLASWNYDSVSGPGQSFGALIVEEGKSLNDNKILWLDTLTGDNGYRLSLDPAEPGYAIAWTVADQSVATISPSGADPWSFSVNGLTVGTTTVTFRLLFNATVELTTGPIRIIVRDSLSPPGEMANFMITKGGVWHIVSRNSGLIAPNYCTFSVSGKLSVAQGELTDLFSFWLPDAADSCRRVKPSSSQRRLVFDFADPSVARVVNHPVHWGEHMEFHLEGLNPGTTTVRIHFVRSDNSVEFTSLPVPVEVTP